MNTEKRELLRLMVLFITFDFYVKLLFCSDNIFAVGHYYSSTSNHNRAELYNLDTDMWTTTGHYPFSSYIHGASVVNHNKAFFVIGGWIEETVYSRLIASFDPITEVWNEAGSLQKSRRGHGAVKFGSNFMVVGGYGETSSLPTELCEVKGNLNVSCFEQEPNLAGYSNYPELFLVPQNFCS